MLWAFGTKEEVYDEFRTFLLMKFLFCFSPPDVFLPFDRTFHPRIVVM